MRRYGIVTAVLYDVFSGERPFYRRGRVAAIDGLRLSYGDRVLVLGCGTGLDLPLLAERIGPSGTIVAVDDSRVMLQAAGRRARTRSGRVQRFDWPEVRLVLADLTRARTVLPPDERPVDAVLAVNTLSLIPDWRRAWRTGIAAAVPGARVAVADIGRPSGSTGMDLWSRVISFVGLGRLDAEPWSAVEQDAVGVEAHAFRMGHVQVRTGRLPA